MIYDKGLMRGPRARLPRLTPERRQALWGICFALPAIAFFLGMFVYPLFYTFYLSLHSWDLLTPPQWVGLGNFEYLLQDPRFQNAIAVTLYYVAGTSISVILLGLPLAAFFTRRFRLRELSLTVFYMPVMVSFTVSSIMWRLNFNPNFGLFTVVTNVLGFRNVPWLTDVNLAMPAIILLSVWKSLPYYTVILLVGMRTISAEYYEAAEVDGANTVQRFLRITLPLLRPILLYVLVISVIGSFQTFTPSYLLTNGGPGEATQTLSLYIYQTAFSDLRMGDAATASVIMFGMMLVATGVQLYLLRHRDL